MYVTYWEKGVRIVPKKCHVLLFDGPLLFSEELVELFKWNSPIIFKSILNGQAFFEQKLTV